MKSTPFLEAGAVESCATPELNQDLATRCGPNGPLDPQGEISAAPAPDLVALSRALRAKAAQHPELSEPIEQIAKAARRLALHDDASLRKTTMDRIGSVIFALQNPSH